MGWGFIGAGRATYILLKGFWRAGKVPGKVVISDKSGDALGLIKGKLEFVVPTRDNKAPASEEMVFLSIPFTEFDKVLHEIRGVLRNDAILISLAPKFTVREISNRLGGFDRVVRLIPNAPSIINKGFNPMFISESIPLDERLFIRNLFSSLGKCVEVDEGKLEAYVLISAASPTYFWFQFMTLLDTAVSLGLDRSEATDAIYHMLRGAVDLLFGSDLSFDEVIDLVPLKPLKKDEEKIKKILVERITEVYNKMKSYSLR